MHRVDPSARFDNVTFTNVIEDGAASSMYACYTCPECSEAVTLAKEDFLGIRKGQESSNLPPDTATRFDDWAAANELSETSYLDWSCPGCDLVVRAYFQRWAGGRHGDFRVDIVAVVEEARSAP